MHHIDAVILDLDGVITRTASVHAKAWKEMFDEYAEERRKRGDRTYMPFDIEIDYPRYIDGKPRYDGVRSFLKSKDIELPEGAPEDAPEDETICGLGNRKNELFQNLIDQEGADVYEDTVRRIREWRERGLKTAVVSSSKNCAAILKATGLSHLFDVRVDGVTAAQLGLSGKPAPDIFLHAAKKLDVSPSRAVVIEDALVGVQAGSAGKFGLVVGVDRQDQEKELLEHGAHIVVKTLEELQSVDEQGTNPPEADNLPNALKHQTEIVRQLEGKRLAIFLDYDGTLTPIVKRPEMAVLSEEMRSVLKQLASRFTVAIISGRDRRDVKKLVALDELIYAGSHGFDISGPEGMQMQNQGGKDALPALDDAENELRQSLASLSGAQVERKQFSIAVHYRNVMEENVQQVERVCDNVLSKHRNLQKGFGKKVIELQPAVEWHKGKALLWLLQKLKLDRPKVVPLYIGDDLTDENGFRAISEGGIGILVGDHGQETAAKYGLKDVAEVRQFLNHLIGKLER